MAEAQQGREGGETLEKTRQYQLNQWAAEDRILREDFNRDNANVEAGLVALGQQITAEKTARAQASWRTPRRIRLPCPL